MINNLDCCSYASAWREAQLATDRRDPQLVTQHRRATITKYENYIIQFDDLWAEIAEISSYMEADNQIVQGMKRRQDWVLRMQKLRMGVMTEYNITDFTDRMDSLATKVSQANTQLCTIIDSIRAADQERHLH